MSDLYVLRKAGLIVGAIDRKFMTSDLLDRLERDEFRMNRAQDVEFMVISTSEVKTIAEAVGAALRGSGPQWTEKEMKSLKQFLQAFESSQKNQDVKPI